MSRRRTGFTSLGRSLAAAFALLSACSSSESPRGGLMLVVSKDGALDVGLLEIHVEAGGKQLLANKYRVPKEAELPTSVAIVSNGEETAQATIKVVGWQVSPGREDVPLDRRDAIVTQIPVDRLVTFRVVLSARCSSTVELVDGEALSTCSEGTTCDPRSGGCTSSTSVDASQLDTYSEDDLLPIDGVAGAGREGAQTAGAGGEGPSPGGGGSAGGGVDEPNGGGDGGTAGTPSEPVSGSGQGGAPEPAAIGEPCVSNQGCESGHCRDDNGSSTCSDGIVGAACDPEDDADCADGRCAEDADAVRWTCSAGLLGDRCSKQAHCIASTCALADVSDTDGSCTDGSNQAVCKLDQHCNSLRCAVGSGGDGTCTTGTLDAVCTVDQNCLTSLCAVDPGGGNGHCTDGQLESDCTDDGDCTAGSCAYSVGLGRGECTDGAIGAFCVTDQHCMAQHCVTGGNSAGTCSAGASGNDCDNAQDCESGSCSNDVCQ